MAHDLCRYFPDTFKTLDVEGIAGVGQSCLSYEL